MQSMLPSSSEAGRSGSALLAVAFVLTAVIAWMAHSTDTAYMNRVRDDWQQAVDQAAITAAKNFSRDSFDVAAVSEKIKAQLVSCGKQGDLERAEVEIGIYDNRSGEFRATSSHPNAVRISCCARCGRLFFSPMTEVNHSTMQVAAVCTWRTGRANLVAELPNRKLFGLPRG